MADSKIIAYHKEQADLAKALYVSSLTSSKSTNDWHVAKALSRKQVFSTLRDTNCFLDMAGGLQKSGSHLLILRHILAPPVSQDQFSLLCPSYPKRNEKTGKALSKVSAQAIEEIILSGRDREITSWLDIPTKPRKYQIKNLIRTITSILSMQSVATLRRSRLSSEQESSVVNLLQSRGWTKQSSGLISNLTDVKRQHFLHKAKFATRTRPQEVDIACGLSGTVVLAMECKVTNDETNSVKRINDVLKKASAWQDHWGSFVHTAALLQGVIAFKDVQRLLEARVSVFWSHDLPTFEGWLENHEKLG